MYDSVRPGILQQAYYLSENPTGRDFPVLRDSFPLQWRMKSGYDITLMDIPTSTAAIYFMYSHL
jgi:hypothetical protein